MTINCIIIEDEPLAQELLEDYISKVDFLSLQGTFNNPLEALPHLKEHVVDLLFLDIEMPKLNGMDFLDVPDELPSIIFTTAYSTYAVKSYEKNAVDYLLKPITFERFLKAVYKLQSPSGAGDLAGATVDDGSVFVKTGKTIVRLRYDEILHISGLKDYVEFHTESNRHIVYHTLRELQEKLPDYFQRIHNSHLVNLDKIESIRDNHVHIGDEKLPISDTYRKELFRKIEERTI